MLTNTRLDCPYRHYPFQHSSLLAEINFFKIVYLAESSSDMAVFMLVFLILGELFVKYQTASNNLYQIEFFLYPILNSVFIYLSSAPLQSLPYKLRILH